MYDHKKSAESQIIRWNVAQLIFKAWVIENLVATGIHGVAYKIVRVSW